ncbi:MAG: hypothetical protein GXP29_11100 [Planctomycetes bacterium]|nr:hypothetical protein [Planctomycetota bacterium]
MKKDKKSSSNKVYDWIGMSLLLIVLAVLLVFAAGLGVIKFIAWFFGIGG